MPTPYGSCGGMAFSAAELHVLRRSLAHALQSSTAPLSAVEVSDCLRLAQSVDDAVQEAGRLRAFLLDDLARYRGALPGSLSGYLELLQNALAAGYEPVPDDLAALRALRANPVAAALLERAQGVAERSVRRRLTAALAQLPVAAPAAPRTRLLALAGGRNEHRPGEEPRNGEPRNEPRPGEEPRNGEPRNEGRQGEERQGDRRPEPEPTPRPKEPPPPERPAERPSERPIPTPGEVFPPRRKPTPPPAAGRAAG